MNVKEIAFEKKYCHIFTGETNQCLQSIRAFFSNNTKTPVKINPIKVGSEKIKAIKISSLPCNPRIKNMPV